MHERSAPERSERKGSSRRSLRPGSVGFTISMSMAISMTALAIDSMLPAFDPIREEFGLAPGATDVAVLITVFMIGLGLGQLPAGLLADRYGRRSVLIGGIVLYIIGAAATVFAPTLGAMTAARFVWGLGAAGPRVAVMAMIRDSFEGEQMARQMSNIMAIFLLVPMVAPSAGAAMIALGSWHYAVWMCAGFAVLVLLLSSRLPATLPVEQRRPLSIGEVGASWKMVLATPGTVPYLVAITIANSAFLSYIASSENIFETVFDLGDLFPILFGAMAIGLAVGSLTNGRVVERVGLRRMLLTSSMASVAAATLMVILAIATDGEPPFALFAPVMLASLMMVQMTTINANTSAMIPLGHVAGSGSAVLGMVPLVAGAIIGSLIDRQFDGTISPIAYAFLGSSVIAFFAIRYALRTAPSRAATS